MALPVPCSESVTKLSDDPYRLAVLRPIEDDILRRTGNRVEEAIFLGDDGRVVFCKGGAEDRIMFTEGELVALRENVDLYTHNHPSTGSLGSSDLSLAMFLGVREANAFGPQWRYRLIRTGATWPDRRAVAGITDRLREDVRHELQRRVDAYRLTAQQAGERYWHKVWTRFVSEVRGVSYIREER